MDIAELIDLAKARTGSVNALGEALQVDPSYVAHWKAGRRRPDASHIASLAEAAGLPILETVAEIESQLSGHHAHIWRAALGKLRAAGVAATVIFTLAISSLLMNPTDAQADTQSAVQKRPVPPRQEPL
jgi:transcriptional regulator with XRE-family HTH domain